jgi:hypothetical protein
MKKVYSSVREAYIGFLLGEVEPVPSTTTSSTNTKSKRRATSPGQSGLIVTRRVTLPSVMPIPNKTVALVEQEEPPPSEWKVSVRLSSDDGNAYDDRRKEIDTSTLSPEDLRILQTSDPFLYYSIPSIRRSSFLFDEGGDIDNITWHDLYGDNNTTCSNQDVHQEQTKRSKSIVRRTSRISTEAHPSLIYDDMLLSSELVSLDDGDVEAM